MVRAAVIAAVYAALTIILAPISYGAFQCRISEALCVLPCLTGAAVPGLFVGCLLSSVLTGAPVLDVVFGSVATLIAAVLTRILAKKKVTDWLLPLPTVLVNALIIGILLRYVYQVQLNLFLLILVTGLGEAIPCYLIGVPLLHVLRKKEGLFSDETDC